MADDPLDDRAMQGAYQAWMHHDHGEHLDDAAWQRLGAGDSTRPERDLMHDHITRCAQCSEVWRAVSFVRQQAEAEGLIERGAPARAPLFRRFAPLAIAATLVVAIGAVIVMRQPAPVDDLVRSTTTLSSIEGLMMAYASDGAPMLLWTPLAGATTYRVEIFSEDGNPLWNGDVAAPPMRWPSNLPPVKGMYRWRVEAQDAAGAIARSRLTPVELTR